MKLDFHFTFNLHKHVKIILPAPDEPKHKLSDGGAHTDSVMKLFRNSIQKKIIDSHR